MNTTPGTVVWHATYGQGTTMTTTTTLTPGMIKVEFANANGRTRHLIVWSHELTIATPEPTTLTPEMINGIALVGQTVTYAHQQWHVHSVEGRDWFAFEGQGGTILDGRLTPNHVTEPRAYLVPAGHKIGDGLGIERAVRNLRRGVCLDKAWV